MVELKFVHFGFVYFRLGGDEGSMMLSWTSLNPGTLVQQMSSFDKYFNFKTFEKFMKQVSMTFSFFEYRAVWWNLKRLNYFCLTFNFSTHLQLLHRVSNLRWGG